MDFFYIFKLFYNNIDSVIISLFTGIITSLFVTRIFFIKESEDEKISRLKQHSEFLYIISGYLSAVLNRYKEQGDIEISTKDLIPIKNKITLECDAFSRMSFKDLDRELYDVAVKNNDLVEEISNKINYSKGVPLKKIKDWYETIFEISELYDCRFSKKIYNRVIYKNIFKDKFVVIILIVTMACVLIA